MIISYQEKIEHLAERLRDIGNGEDHLLRDFLKDMQGIISETFGESSQYATYLNNIRFKPASFFASDSEYTKTWRNGVHQVRNLLHMMINDDSFEEPSPAPQLRIRPELEAVKTPPMPREDQDPALDSFHRFNRHVGETMDGIKERVLDRATNNRLVDDGYLEENGLAQTNAVCASNEQILLVPSQCRVLNSTLYDFFEARLFDCVQLEPTGVLRETLDQQLHLLNNVSFAVVVLSSKSDCGPALADGKSVDNQFGLFALGYLKGKLGRERVVVVCDDPEMIKGLSMYSDLTFISFRANHQMWQNALLSRLNACHLLCMM